MMTALRCPYPKCGSLVSVDIKEEQKEFECIVCEVMERESVHKVDEARKLFLERIGN